ncbi:MAG: sigma 54-interacting transcriptional regulator [Deltaproteobacteria bacterium]|nr:sigma 54-interacting transcriptional regulator [Deltaproteobacteria bacterium]
MRFLRIALANGLAGTFALDEGTWFVGRDSGCAFVIADDSVSRRHARVDVTGDVVVIEDLGSKNGVLVNGAPITRANLTPGDAVHIGDVRAMFVESAIGNEPPRPSTTLVVERSNGPVEQRLRLFYELADCAAQSPSPADVVARALDIVGRHLDCENAYLDLYDEIEQRLAGGFIRNFGPAPGDFVISRTILDRVMRTGRGVIVRDAAVDDELHDKASVVQSGVRSIMCVPLQVAGAVDGVLYVDTRSRVKEYGASDIEFLDAYASMLGAVLRTRRSLHEMGLRNEELASRSEGPELVGESAVMDRTRTQIRRMACRGDAHVLITGETGVGKDIAAHLLHRWSSRANKPFEVLNCAAVPRDLLESELFGHVKGAFTSANRDRRGLFELADGGVLFLDEIGELPLDLQSKLLRVLEDGVIRPIGSSAPVRSVDVRVVAATNRDLRAMIRAGTFREDLFHRLGVLEIAMPPLRDHAGDIPALARMFLHRLGRRINATAERFSPAALDVLTKRPWPGNVRELRNVVHHALVQCEEYVIEPAHLKFTADDDEDDASPSSPPSAAAEADATRPLEALAHDIEALERTRILAALGRHHWNRSLAASELGIARKTLWIKMKKYHLI